MHVFPSSNLLLAFSIRSLISQISKPYGAVLAKQMAILVAIFVLYISCSRLLTANDMSAVKQGSGVRGSGPITKGGGVYSLHHFLLTAYFVV